MTRTDFERILGQHQSMVYSIAFSFFNSRTLAEETAQDVFLQMYEKRKSIRIGKHAEFWLRRTVTHRCIDKLRRGGTHQEIELELLPELPVPPVEPDPFLEQKLRRLVASLPENLRATLVLRYGEDMDVADIATIMEIPQNTVRTHLERGLALLRDKANRSLGDLNNGLVRERSR